MRALLISVCIVSTIVVFVLYIMSRKSSYNRAIQSSYQYYTGRMTVVEQNYSIDITHNITSQSHDTSSLNPSHSTTTLTTSISTTLSSTSAVSTTEG